jgi:hypothetical protein
VAGHKLTTLAVKLDQAIAVMGNSKRQQGKRRRRRRGRSALDETQVLDFIADNNLWLYLYAVSTLSFFKCY